MSLTTEPWGIREVSQWDSLPVLEVVGEGIEGGWSRATKRSLRGRSMIADRWSLLRECLNCLGILYDRCLGLNWTIEGGRQELNLNYMNLRAQIQVFCLELFVFEWRWTWRCLIRERTLIKRRRCNLNLCTWRCVGEGFWLEPWCGFFFLIFVERLSR